MEALELLQQRREQLEQHLRQGWLSLAQARYSLGCHRVSSLQYGATMVPRVRVTLAVEVAELQATMEAAAARYRQLLRQKRHRDGDSGDSGDSQTPTGTPGDTQTPTGTPGDTEGDTVTSVTA
ncbi:hypothetical protein DUI87_35351 [Hirundo rustica rustica]|uniref:Vacuolar ATPase assembly protein VMA22 n=1 Tax=Hirundo rustica rustica TaxID=333673 RepID=A0A3M0IJH2_HIRRU|nr:hypothetical protein DUI87_35351 [Hirundo rustica rustica]